MIGNSMRCVFGHRIHLDDARNLGAPTPRNRLACLAGAGDRFELFARDTILLAEADCLEAPSADVGTHGSHVEPKPLGDLVE
jgi:hypothetical protein